MMDSYDVFSLWIPVATKLFPDLKVGEAVLSLQKELRTDEVTKFDARATSEDSPMPDNELKRVLQLLLTAGDNSHAILKAYQARVDSNE